MGHPELAATDAYRAAIIAHQMSEVNTISDARYTSAGRYLRSENIHMEERSAWTAPHRRFISDEGWLFSPLASILINDVPRCDRPGDKQKYFSPTNRKTIYLALEIRALYRLCGALYECGGGARSDALGMIDDIERRCTALMPWEWRCFQRLGMTILDDTFQPWDSGLGEVDYLGNPVVAANTPRRVEEQTKMKDEMRAKTAKLEFGHYPWDTYEPDMSRMEWQDLLTSAIDECSDCRCKIDVVENESTGTYAQLFAAQDIRPKELVLSKETTFSASTKSASEVDLYGELYSRCRHYCQICFSVMTVPSTKSTRPNGDFQYSPNTKTATCSKACRQAQEYLNPSIALSNTESSLRKSHLEDLTILKPVLSRQTDCLVDLVLFRVLTHALSAEKHPLEVIGIPFASRGPNPVSKTPHQWSFANDVIRPIHHLNRLFSKSATDQFAQLDKCDGWILHTLRAKIRDGIHISSQPPCKKSYNGDLVLSAFRSEDYTLSPPPPYLQTQTGEEAASGDPTLFATLTPFKHLIRIADRQKGEVPNVLLRLGENKVRVYATEAIKMGEVLLRAADRDDLGGARGDSDDNNDNNDDNGDGSVGTALRDDEDAGSAGTAVGGVDQQFTALEGREDPMPSYASLAAILASTKRGSERVRSDERGTQIMGRNDGRRREEEKPVKQHGASREADDDVEMDLSLRMELQEWAGTL